MSHFNRDTRHPQRPLLYEHVTPDRDETSSFQYKTEAFQEFFETEKFQRYILKPSQHVETETTWWAIISGPLGFYRHNSGNRCYF